MKKMEYENKLERPKRTTKIRGITVSLIWDGHDWIIDKKTALERESGAKDKEGELCQV